MIAKFVVIFVLLIAENVSADSEMGPLNINLLSTSTCDGDQGYVKLDVVSIGDKKGFNMVFDIPFPLDQSISYDIVVDKVVNGQLQEGVFRHTGAYLCEDFGKFLGTVWSKALQAMGIPETCPISEGQYSTENFPVNNEDIGIDKFYYGLYKMNVFSKKLGEIVSCLVIEFENNEP